MSSEPMPVLSIIACEMLEDELVYVLSKDHDLNQLIVVENRQSFRFVRKLKSKNCQPRLFPLDRVFTFLKETNNSLSMNLLKFLVKFPFFEKIRYNITEKNKEKVTVVVNTLKLGLHADCELLRSEIYQNIRKMAAFSDGILIFYGNCGHSLRNTEADFKDLHCSLYPYFRLFRRINSIFP
jgi:hypothetical protein